MNLALYLLCLVQLGLVASAPIQKVITNHCEGQDCEIKIQFLDARRDISLQTSSNDSVVSALLDITIPRDESSDQNDLVSLMGNVVQMLSSMMQVQQDNHQQLDNMVQQLDMEPQPSTTTELLDYLTTSPEPEIVTTQPVITTTQTVIATTQTVITTTQGPMQDCANAPSSGQYSIAPHGGTNPFLAVCDMDTSSGGWIVIQRRFDGSVDFDRNWVDYENGFGSLDGEFWLGLNKMHQLTSQGTWKLRFDLEDFDGNHAYAEYGLFKVGDSASNYQLTIASYSGDAGDAMIGNHNLNGMAFTTKDRDNDERSNYGATSNCGIFYGGGWWHSNCAYSCINAVYDGQNSDRQESRMTWYQWNSEWGGLKKTEMKIICVD